MSKTTDKWATDDGHVAVIGMACRFPGADNLERFWSNLVGGVDSVTRFPSRSAPGTDSTDERAEYIPAHGLLDRPEWFDAGLFGYAPLEATIIDPQQRLFLECSLEALEHAGCDPQRDPGLIGLYAGGHQSSYAAALVSQQAQLPGITDLEIRVSTGMEFLATRVAYKLGLQGPAIAVQAACASSLVAVHMAVQALLSGDCDVALAGGVSVRVPAATAPYVEGGIIARDGKCRAFDAAAQGLVGADGVGVVVLKRLPDAIADRDWIHAVVRGSAVTNDGRERAGFTAPGVRGQATAIHAAHQTAQVEADSIGYVEAHGAGTPVGDPIEFAALVRAFQAGTANRGFCSIGSVKTNIGHADAAAGVAGFIKTVLVLERGLIPPSLHFSQPNPQIDFESSPFHINTELREWRRGSNPRRAGVSSIGLGGTNVHVVLEEPPPPSPVRPGRPWQLIVLSAKTRTALNAASAMLAEHLRTHPEMSLADVAWTLQVGRRELAHRCVVVAADREDAIQALSRGAPEPAYVTDGGMGTRPVVLVFPETPPRPDLGEVLAARWPAVREGIDDCALTDGAAVVLACALARFWMRLGVRPSGVTGLGPGMLPAAVVAGVFRLREAVRLAVASASPALQDGLLWDLVRLAMPRTPQLAVLSHPGGEQLPPETLTDPGFWVEQLARSPTPASARRSVPPAGLGRVWLTVAPDSTTGVHPGPIPWLLEAVGRAWLAGTPVSWAVLHEADAPRRVPLPTYAFERQRYFLDAAEPLADLDGDRGGRPSSVPPKAPHEGETLRLVAELFAEALGLSHIDVQESFFDMGGDSLVATRLLLRIRQRLPVDIALRAIFEAPSAAQLADQIDQRLGRQLGTGA